MFVLCRFHVDDVPFTDMHDASKRLAESLFDSYESDWAGEEDLGAIVEVSVIISGNERTSPALTLQFLLHKYKSSRILLLPGDQKPYLPLSLYIINVVFMLCLLIRGRTSCGPTMR